MRVPKLYLTNERLPVDNNNNRIYDSLENRPIKSELDNRAILFNSISKTQPLKEAAASGSKYCIYIDHKGNYVETEKANEKNNSQSFKKDVVHKPAKFRINTPVMNRIVDCYHDVPDDGLSARVARGEVIGGKLSKVESYYVEKPSCLKGPGEYDISTYEKGKFGPSQHAMPFGNTPRFDDVSGSLSQSHSAKAKKYRSKKNNTDSLNSISEYTEYNENKYKELPETKRYTGGNGVIKWNDKDRFDDPLHRQPFYWKTSGCKLGPNFDEKFQTMAPIVFRTSKRSEYKDNTTANIEINTPDWGPKASIMTAALKSPIKYSAAFISKAPVGLVITKPTSGVDAFMKYDGAYAHKTCVEIKDPKKNSYYFLRERKFPVQPASLDPYVEPKKFSEWADHGITFTTAGVIKSHKLELRNKKINSVYPAFLKEKKPIVYGYDYTGAPVY
jgi:hypothetical protein